MTSEWDPRADNVLADQGAAYDAMRKRCPVAHSDYLGWSIFRHADVLRVLLDHHSFSNVVSRHPSVPNGMDPPQHTRYRAIIEPYFGKDRMDAFEPSCRAVARRLAQRLPSDAALDFMADFAQDFALEIQCAFMGWPADLHEPLRQWTRRNHDATLSGNRDRTAAVAFEFDHQIRTLLAARREARRGAKPAARRDVTSQLMRERIGGRFLSDEEIVSILRNWTVGELATIASSVGIVAGYLADRPELQRRLREQPSLIPDAIDEILRIDAPLIANSRRTTKAVELAGRRIEAGERVTVIWASANRDEEAFGDPDAFRTDRPAGLNVLYGTGIHVCPGAPLARLELRIVTEELLGHTTAIEPAAGQPAVRAVYPAGGFSFLPLTVRQAATSATAR